MKRPNIKVIKRVRRNIRMNYRSLDDFKRRTGNRLRRDRSLMRGAPKAINKRIDAAFEKHHAIEEADT